MVAMSSLIGFKLLILEMGVGGGGGEDFYRHRDVCPPTCLPSHANVPAAVSVVSRLLSY